MLGLLTKSSSFATRQSPLYLSVTNGIHFPFEGKGGEQMGEWKRPGWLAQSCWTVRFCSSSCCLHLSHYFQLSLLC